jgi:hypothetical protein
MRWFIFSAAAALALASGAAAQTRHATYYQRSSRPNSDRPAATCASGELTRIRVSKIKSGGSMAGFRDAVAAHTRWYQSHGYRIEQRIAPVMTSGKGSMQVSPDEVMTLATSADVPREKRDAGWAAFVAKYKANSTIERETIVCLPA